MGEGNSLQRTELEEMELFEYKLEWANKTEQ